jgi:hypothetical protein
VTDLEEARESYTFLVKKILGIRLPGRGGDGRIIWGRYVRERTGGEWNWLRLVSGDGLLY